MYNAYQLIACAFLSAAISSVVSNILWYRYCERTCREWRNFSHDLREERDSLLRENFTLKREIDCVREETRLKPGCSIRADTEAFQQANRIIVDCLARLALEITEAPTEEATPDA